MSKSARSGTPRAETGDKTQLLMNKIINKYKTSDLFALDIQLKEISKEQFEKLYNGLSNSKNYTFYEIDQSVNTLSHPNADNSGHSAEVLLIRCQKGRGNGFSDEKICKTSVETPVTVRGYITYSIHLNEEKTNVVFNTDFDAKMRIKIGCSFIDKSGTWMICLSAIKESNMSVMDKSSLARIVKNMFVNMDEKNFLDQIKYKYIDLFEIGLRHIGKKNELTPASFKIVDEIFGIVDEKYQTEYAKQNEIYRVAKMILENRRLLDFFRTTYGLKKLLPPAIPLDKVTYNGIFPPSGYYVTEKADGERAVISTDNTSGFLIYTNMNNFEYNEGFGRYIAEGELVEFSGKRVLLLFDVMMYKNKLLINEPLSKRLSYLADAAAYFSKFTEPNIKVQPKTFLRLETPALKETLEKIYYGEYPYGIDGVMLVTPDKGYHHTVTYKYKGEHSSIDFFVVKAPEKMLGKHPFIRKTGYDLYILFVGISYSMQQKLGITTLPAYNDIFPNRNGFGKNIRITDNYNPIQFSPSANPGDYIYYHPTEKNGGEDLNHKIVEMKKTPVNGVLGDWKFVRVRHDRKPGETYYGNDYRTAETIYMDYVDPMTFEQLYNPEVGYFTKYAENIYKPGNNFRRYVINLLIKKYYQGKNILFDLGGGRGAEIKKYISARVKSVFFMDIDPQALAQLNKRKIDIVMSKKLGYIFSENNKTHGTKINIIQADLKTKFPELLEKVESYGITGPIVDGIMSNFVFHYFCDYVENLDNVIKFVSAIMRIGGHITITVMDGEKIFEKLENYKYGESWVLKNSGKPVYEIKKLYEGKKLANVGQKIAVRVPFADDLYEEPLCNIDFLIERFCKHGFNLELNNNFNDYLSEYEKTNCFGFRDLLDIDTEYSGLFRCISLCKMKNMPKKIIGEKFSS